MSARKCKTVSFDLTDRIESELLIHAELNGNFSRYVKRLIEADRGGGTLNNRIAIVNVTENDDDDDALSLL